jgi:phage terminase large subunit-like protein
MPATTTKTRSSSKSSSRTRTRGFDAVDWIQKHCILAEGDYYGQPFRLRDWQKRFLLRLYAVDEQGHRLVHQALLGLPSGNGKSELAAAIAAYELASDSRVSPIVAVAAASWEQADHVFGALKTMCRVSKTLSQVTEVFDTEILLRGMPGRAYRVAAVAGTNEGQRPTVVIGDELHEWLGQRERVWAVLTKSLAKRQDTLALGITTAGWDHDSVCYRLYEQGKKIESGEIPADGFLFEWHEAPADSEVDDRKAWRACNPALGDFLAEENLAQSFHVLPEHEARRYHLNQWVTRGRQWLPLDPWNQLANMHDVPEGERIVLGFDGSLARDTTALIGCTLEGYVFVVGAWEKPADADREWMVPRAEVDAVVAQAFERWDVAEMACDRSWWPGEFQAWSDEFGEERVVEFPNTPSRMGPACQRFHAAVMAGQLSHDGDARLARHLQNAVTKETRYGTHVTKEARGSPRKIDLAVAAVMAYERAMYHAGETEEGPLIAWA